MLRNPSDWWFSLVSTYVVSFFLLLLLSYRGKLQTVFEEPESSIEATSWIPNSILSILLCNFFHLVVILNFSSSMIFMCELMYKTTSYDHRQVFCSQHCITKLHCSLVEECSDVFVEAPIERFPAVHCACAGLSPTEQGRQAVAIGSPQLPQGFCQCSKHEETG